MLLCIILIERMLATGGHQKDMVTYLHLASVVVVQVLLDLARVKSAFGVEGMGKGQRRNWGAQKKKRKKLCAPY